jgi:hypothetical protein
MHQKESRSASCVRARTRSGNFQSPQSTKSTIYFQAMSNQRKQAGGQIQTLKQRMMSSLGPETHPAVEVRKERAKPRGQIPTYKSEFSKSISDGYFIPGIMGRARCLTDAQGLSSERRRRRPSRYTIKGSSVSSIPVSTRKIQRCSSVGRISAIPVSSTSREVQRRSSMGWIEEASSRSLGASQSFHPGREEVSRIKTASQA